MALPVSPGQVLALVRETRVLASLAGHISVSGPGAVDVADALAAGGDPAAVVVGGDAARAAVAVRVVDGAPSPAEVAELRRLTRLSKPIVVLRRGGVPVPYALPADVLDADDGVPLELLAAAIGRAAPDAAPGLAARLPVLRPAVERRLVDVTSWGNAIIAASPRSDGPDLPLLSIAQGRMLLLLGTSRGEMLPHDPKAVAQAAGPPVAAGFAVGLAARALVRRLPLHGPVTRAAVAYGVTRALGTVGARLP